MRVVQLCRHVEFEVLGVVNHAVPEPDAVGVAFLDNLLLQNRLKQRVDHDADILE